MLFMKKNKVFLLIIMLCTLTKQIYCAQEDHTTILDWSLVHHYQNHFNSTTNDINYQHPTTRETALHQAIRAHQYNDALKLLTFPGINPHLVDNTQTSVKELVIEEIEKFESIQDPKLKKILDRLNK